ncbi:colipase isoform X2 [Petaurus breviceps papuanus]|uniref:colipase isoform X2 n=1 Tax=Petaurus breviceps papuanus TaxID=3040969 RepID=UPI0036DC055F
MQKVLILLLISLAVAYAAPDPRGLVINLSLYGVYYKCPCERGLSCEGDKSIVGSITNTNFGVCLDVGRSKE